LVLALLASRTAGREFSVFSVGSGTTAVVIRTDRVLVAAVDSRETWREYGAGAHGATQQSVCKLRAAGPFYVLVAGIDRASNGFSALDEAANAYRPGDTLRELAARARDRLRRSLEGVVESAQLTGDGEFARRFAGQPLLQLTIAGRESAVAAAALIEISADERDRVSSRLRLCPGDCTGTVSTIFLGIHDEIDTLVNRDRRILLRRPEALAVSLIEMEAAAHPDAVGGPVSMVRFGKSGGEVIRDGACPVPGGSS
jgi:hypothetical protein